MQLADCSPSTLPAGDRLPQVSGQNQTAYLRLKLSFSLNLRRQIFLAVCDDLALRNRLAARLYAELAYPSANPLTTESDTLLLRQNGSAAAAVPGDHRLSTLADEPDAASHLPGATLSARLLYPRLVSLNLNLNDPNPMVQIAEWLAEYPPPQGSQQHRRSPGFQIFGIERLTRQPAVVQKGFLHSLQQIEHYLSCLESPLLLWLPRPWLNAVKQSAPNFWNWHTALFEFEGDPTPVRSVAARLNPQPERPQHQHATGETVDRAAVDLPLVEPPQSAIAVSPLPLSVDPAASHTVSAPLKESLWDILSHDLALLNTTQTASSPLHQRESPSPGSVTVSAILPVKGSLPIAGNAPHPDDQPAKAVMPVLITPEVDSPVADSPETDSLVVDSLSISVVETAHATTPTLTVVADPTVADLTLAEATVAEATNADPAKHRQAALAVADLILAVVAEDVGETPSSENTSIVQALQQLEQLHVQQASETTLLAAYQTLGHLCRDRIEQGNASLQHLLLTVCVYEQTLPWLDDDSLLWSDVLNDIGNLYWMLSRQESAVDDSLTYLELAIAAYQHALAKTNAETRPHNYAMIQNNLGSAYGDMARFRHPADSLQQSVAAYELALRYRPLSDDPARYAATQNNLGTAYWNLAQHQQPLRRLKQAIAAYFEALRYYSPDCEPMHYAMIQNNLGTAYWNLAQQPQANLGVGTAQGKSLSAADLLQRAIAAYRAALVYRTLTIAPAAYAATQNNLGTAHWQFASLLDSQPDQRYDQLQQAIAAYKATIAAVEDLATANSPLTLSFDPAATHNNLGLAYYQCAIAKHSKVSSAQRSANLEAALQHHLHALQAWQTQPDLYQTVFSYVIQTLRAFHNEFGSKGQTVALSQIPANLLPEVLKQL